MLALEATDPGDTRTGPTSAPCEPLICNLGSGSGFSNRQVVAAAEAVVGRPITVKMGPRRPGDPPILVASPQMAHEKLGWNASRGTLEQIIGSAWAWQGAHPAGYAK
jgi:UDP-glucose 4-epimerase